MSEWIIPWIDFLRWEFVRLGAYKPGEEYQWAKFDTAPLAQLTKKLSESRISFWSNAAARTKDQEIWEKEETGEWADDLSWREIPKNADVEKLVYAGTSNPDADADKNMVFPLDRFRELENEGFIGELAPIVFSSHPTFRRASLTRDTAPKLVERLKELKIDALVFLPM
jgi:D-proline reductase (dithiol) PrdB